MATREKFDELGTELDREFIKLSSSAKEIGDMKFGRLTVIGPVGHDKGKRLIWECVCACGRTVRVTGSSLRTGKTKSCGCHKSDRLSLAAKKHGLTGTYLHRVWKGIIARCYNQNVRGYRLYGGRGIRMHEPWRNSFTEFLRYLKGLEHSDERGYSIDRIDTNGDYEPGNIRFATAQEQSRNRRSNTMLFHDGKEQCIAAWAEETGLSSSAISARIALGWPSDRVLSEPIQTKHSHPRIKKLNQGDD